MEFKKVWNAKYLLHEKGIMMEKWIEVVYGGLVHERFINVKEVCFGENFLTFKTENNTRMSINLNFVIKIGTQGV